MKLTLAEMKRRCTDHFFSPATMQFFRDSKHKAYYDEKRDTNYKVVSPNGDIAWHRFDEETGKTYPVKGDVFIDFRKEG
jgi:hypothetical protein